MRENLPPPNWSPTGNSGYWKWRENKKGEMCWQWFDDGNNSVDLKETCLIKPKPPKKEKWKDKIWRYLSIWRQSWPH